MEGLLIYSMVYALYLSPSFLPFTPPSFGRMVLFWPVCFCTPVDHYTFVHGLHFDFYHVYM